MIYLIQVQLNLEFVLNELQALQAIDHLVLSQLSKWLLLLATGQDCFGCIDRSWLPRLPAQYIHIYNFLGFPQFPAINTETQC